MGWMCRYVGRVQSRLRFAGLSCAFLLVAQGAFGTKSEDPKAYYFSVTVDGTEFRIKRGEYGRAVLCYNFQHPYSGDVRVPANVTDPNTGITYHVYHVEQYAFENCTGLTRLEFADGVTDLGHNAFNGCSNLETLVLGHTVESLWKYTFTGCSSLKTIAFGKSDKAFEVTSTFAGADNVTVCYCYDRDPKDIAATIGEGKYAVPAADPFVEIGKRAVLYVPYGTRDAYRTKRGWENFKDIREFILLDEDETLDLQEAVPGLRVVFQRTMKAGQWNSYCAPLAFTAEEIAEVFGEGTEVLAFSPETTEGTLKFYTTTTIEPNVPYMINPTKSWATYVFESKDVAKPQAGTVSSPAYSLTGVFDLGYVPQNSYFLSKNTYYKATKANTNRLKGYRTYLSAVSASPAKSLAFRRVSATTGVEVLETELPVVRADVYGLDGRLVRRGAASLEGLPRGVYIVNGKKKLVR